jgi:hypothetical protein
MTQSAAAVVGGSGLARSGHRERFFENARPPLRRACCVSNASRVSDAAAARKSFFTGLVVVPVGILLSLSSFSVSRIHIVTIFSAVLRC